MSSEGREGGSLGREEEVVSSRVRRVGVIEGECAGVALGEVEEDFWGRREGDDG